MLSSRKSRIFKPNDGEYQTTQQYVFLFMTGSQSGFFYEGLTTTQNRNRLKIGQIL